MVKQRHILMLIENNPFPQDVRVEREARTLTGAGYRVSVIAPRAPGQPWRETVDGTRVWRFPAPPEGQGAAGYAVEYSYSFVALAALSLALFVRHRFHAVHVNNPPTSWA